MTFVLFALTGQALSGDRVHSEQPLEHGEAVPAFGAYLGSGHFLEARQRRPQAASMASR